MKGVISKAFHLSLIMSVATAAVCPQNESGVNYTWSDIHYITFHDNRIVFAFQNNTISMFHSKGTELVYDFNSHIPLVFSSFGMDAQCIAAGLVPSKKFEMFRISDKSFILYDSPSIGFTLQEFGTAITVVEGTSPHLVVVSDPYASGGNLVSKGVVFIYSLTSDCKATYLGYRISSNPSNTKSFGSTMSSYGNRISIGYVSPYTTEILKASPNGALNYLFTMSSPTQTTSNRCGLSSNYVACYPDYSNQDKFLNKISSKEDGIIETSKLNFESLLGSLGSTCNNGHVYKSGSVYYQQDTTPYIDSKEKNIYFPMAGTQIDNYLRAGMVAVASIATKQPIAFFHAKSPKSNTYYYEKGAVLDTLIVSPGANTSFILLFSTSQLTSVANVDCGEGCVDCIDMHCKECNFDYYLDGYQCKRIGSA